MVIYKIDHCIHIHWCIPMGLGHNDPWVESHMWPQQMWGQRSSRGQWPLVQVFAKRVTVSTYFDVFSWDLDTMILGKSHICDVNSCGVKGHLGVNDLWFKFFAKKVTVYTCQRDILLFIVYCNISLHILWCIFMGLGHNDPWVEQRDITDCNISLGRATHKTSTDMGSKVI